MENKLKEWLKNPTYNPSTGKNDVVVSLQEDSSYVKLYNKAFKMLRKNHMKTHNILKKMPTDHLLFDNKIDYLYVFYNLDNSKYPYEGKDKKYLLYKDYNKSSDNDLITNIIFDKLSYIINYNTNTTREYYEKELLDSCNKYLLSCINFFIILIRHKIFNNYTLDDLYRDYNEESYEKMNDINNIMNFFNFVGYDYKNNSYDINDELYDDDDLNINIEEAIMISISVFKLIDYKKNGKDVIEIVKEHKFKIIEDPLIKLLSKEEFKDIDINNLELPKQNMTDNEYKKLTHEYAELLDKFNKEKSIAMSNSKSPPKRAILELPNKTKLIIGIHKIPKQNYSDAEYKNIKSQYKKNIPIIELYKKLINTGFLDLNSSKTSKSISSPRTSSSSNSISSLRLSMSILNKSRENIIKDDLFDDTIIDDSRLLRCINNTDIISQDDFTNPNYPLAKLQLITKLKIKDASGKLLRTDCYYTPNLYNHLVTLANEKKPFTDPYNGKYLLTDNDIKNIMKIMKIIDPKIEKPRYIKSSNDKQFMIDAEINEYNLYNVYVYRLFGNTKFKILILFTFPADIEIEDTGSSDITSATLLLKIIELFNNGKLMITYLPPYNEDGYYLLPDINYNAYNNVSKWIKMTRKNKIELFKNMVEELSSL